jgi:hypothetical protein
MVNKSGHLGFFTCLEDFLACGASTDPEQNIVMTPKSKKKAACDAITDSRSPTHASTNDDAITNARSQETLMEDNETEANKLKVDTDVPSIEVIQKLLVTDLWSDDKEIVCQALNLALIVFQNDPRPSKMRDIANSGAPTTILGVMYKFDNDSKVLAKASALLAECSRSNIRFADSCVRVGAIATICQAMDSFPKKPSLNYAGCHAIYELLTSTTYRATACSHIILRSLVNAASEFRGSSKLQFHVVAIIELLMDFRGHQNLLDSGVMEIMGAVYSDQTSQPETKRVAKSIIAKLLVDDESSIATSKQVASTSCVRQCLCD